MASFRCYYLTVDNRIAGIPVELFASDADTAVLLAADLYARRDPAQRNGIEIWVGERRVFAGDPLSACTATAAA